MIRLRQVPFSLASAGSFSCRLRWLPKQADSSSLSMLRRKGNVTRSLEPFIIDKDYLIPRSCCRFKKRCTIARNITIAKNFTPKKGIYGKGCATVIDGHMQLVLEQAEVILLSDAALDVFGILCIWLLFVVIRHELAKEQNESPRTNV